MHSYDYLRLTTSSLHIVLIILSLIVMWIYSKKITFEKAPLKIDNNFLFISNAPNIGVIVFCFTFTIVNVAYITNFFNRIPKYAYIIPLLIACAIF